MSLVCKLHAMSASLARYRAGCTAAQQPASRRSSGCMRPCITLVNRHNMAPVTASAALHVSSTTNINLPVAPALLCVHTHMCGNCCAAQQLNKSRRGPQGNSSTFRGVTKHKWVLRDTDKGVSLRSKTDTLICVPRPAGCQARLLLPGCDTLPQPVSQPSSDRAESLRVEFVGQTVGWLCRLPVRA